MRRTRTIGLSIGVAVTAVVAGSLAVPSTAVAQAEPIKIFSIVPEGGPAGTSNFPEHSVGLKAAVTAINKRGGIKGRQIQLSTCPDKQDQNTAAACARRAVSENPVAVVGTSSRFASSYFP